MFSSRKFLRALLQKGELLWKKKNLDPVKYPDAKQKYRFELLDVSDFDYNVFKKQPSHKYQYVGLLFND